MNNLNPDPNDKKQNTTDKLFKPKTIDEFLDENRKYFKFYNDLPIIITVLLALNFSSWTLIATTLTSSFIVAILGFVIGAVVCLIAYYISKIVFSYKILHIYLLEKIKQNTENNTDMTNGNNIDINNAL